MKNIKSKILAAILAIATITTAVGCSKEEPIEVSSDEALINVDRDDGKYKDKTSETASSSSSSSSESTSEDSKPETKPVTTTHPNVTGERPTGGEVYNTTVKKKEEKYPKFGRFDLEILDEGSEQVDKETGAVTKSYSVFERTFTPYSYGEYWSEMAVTRGARLFPDHFTISVEKNDKNKNAFEFEGIGQVMSPDKDKTKAEFYFEFEKDGEIFKYDEKKMKGMESTEYYHLGLKAMAVKLDKDEVEYFDNLYNAAIDPDVNILFYIDLENNKSEKAFVGMSYDKLIEYIGEGEELIEELLDENDELVQTNYYYAWKSGDYILVVQKETAQDKNNIELKEYPENATEYQQSQIDAENKALIENGVPRDIVTTIILIKEATRIPFSG